MNELLTQSQKDSSALHLQARELIEDREYKIVIEFFKIKNKFYAKKI